MCPFELDPCQVRKEPRHRHGYRLQREDAPAALQPTMVTLRAAPTPEAVPSLQAANPVQSLHNTNPKYETAPVFWTLLHSRIMQELAFGLQHNRDD